MKNWKTKENPEFTTTRRDGAIICNKFLMQIDTYPV